MTFKNFINILKNKYNRFKYDQLELIELYYITEDDLIVRYIFKYKINRYLFNPGPENEWEYTEILERPGYEKVTTKHQPIPDDGSIIKELEMLVDMHHCKVFIRYAEIEELEM